MTLETQYKLYRLSNPNSELPFEEWKEFLGKKLEKGWNEITAQIESDPSKVTRIEVIDNEGRVYTKWDCKIQLSFQDEGRTLKIFVDEISKD